MSNKKADKNSIINAILERVEAKESVYLHGVEYFNDLQKAINSSMQTAMQELISLLKKREFKKGYWLGEEIEMAQSLLEKEKKQIVDAVNHCWETHDSKGYVPSGEEYYSTTYPTPFNPLSHEQTK